MKTKKLWGSAFTQTPTQAVVAFAAGRDMATVLASDAKLITYDLWTNKAHCLMLAKQGIIPTKDAVKILAGLAKIQTQFEKGKFSLPPDQEDVHSSIESLLTSMMGIDIAGKIHTARSRNDQVATDMRLFLRDQVLAFVQNSSVLVTELIAQAQTHKKTVMPGFTHHQHAMVTTWGHTCAAFASMLLRDMERFTQWYDLHNTSPLGATVAYGTQFPIKRHYSAKLMAFDEPQTNALDSVTNRWEAEADLAYAVTMLMNHLSLMAQTMMVLATSEFGMVTVSDAYSTGSSIMPQKKNPDTLEVIKGKASYISGLLTGLVGLGKANFMGYNRDSQWTKYMIMDVVEEALPAAIVMKGVVESLTLHKDVMESWCNKGFVGATSLMEHITSTFNLPMRKAKIIIEKSVKYSIGHELVTHVALIRALKEQDISIVVSEQQLNEWQDPLRILSLTQSFGSPGIASMEKMHKILRSELDHFTMWHKDKHNKITGALTLISKETNLLSGGRHGRKK